MEMMPRGEIGHRASFFFTRPRTSVCVCEVEELKMEKEGRIGERQERKRERRRRKGRIKTRTPHADHRDQEGVNNLVELRSGSGF